MAIELQGLTGYSGGARRGVAIRDGQVVLGAFMDDVLHYSGSLSAAKDAIGLTDTVLTVSEPVTVSSSLDLSTTGITLNFINTGKITVGAGATLKVKKINAAGNRQIFDVSASNAKVLFARNAYQYINIGWLCGTANGTDATKAINSALESCALNDGGLIFVPEAQYISSGGHVIPKATGVIGTTDFITPGYGGTSITLTSPTATYLFKIGEQTYDTHLSGMTLIGGVTTNRNGLLMEGSGLVEGSASGKCAIERVTFNGLRWGVNFNTLSVGNTWQMAQVSIKDSRFINCGSGIRQSSVNSSWAVENVNFYPPASGVGVDVVAGGIMNFKSCEWAGNLFAGTTGVLITGSHVNMNFIGCQSEGLTAFLQNDASDKSGVINFFGNLIQDKIQINAACTINSYGNNYPAQVFKFGGVGTIARITSADFIQSIKVDTGEAVDPTLTEGGANNVHIISENNREMYAITTRIPTKIVAPEPNKADTIPMWVLGSITDGGTYSRKVGFIGRLDADEDPLYGYHFGRSDADGWLEWEGNQADPYKGWRCNFAIRSQTQEPLIIPVSDETTDLTTGTAKITFRMPYAFKLIHVRASVATAPTGSTLIVDVNENGASILSTKLSINAGEKTSFTAASAVVISDSDLTDDAEITIDIDQIGSSVAGKGLKVTLFGYRV